MELYMSAFLVSLTPEVVAAMLGGLIGSLIVCSNYVAIYGWRLSGLLLLGGILLSASVAEYVSVTYDMHLIFFHISIGITSGMLAYTTLDGLKVILPSLMPTLIRGTGETAIDIIKNKIKKIFGG